MAVREHGASAAGTPGSGISRIRTRATTPCSWRRRARLRELIQAVRHRHLPERQLPGDCVGLADVASPVFGAVRSQEVVSEQRQRAVDRRERACRSVDPSRLDGRRTRSPRGESPVPGWTLGEPVTIEFRFECVAESVCGRVRPRMRASLAVDDTAAVRESGSRPECSEISRAPAASNARAVVVLRAPLFPENAVRPWGSRHAEACRRSRLAGAATWA